MRKHVQTVCSHYGTAIIMLSAYAEVGCQYVIFRMPDWNDPEAIRLFDEQVIPALKDA